MDRMDLDEVLDALADPALNLSKIRALAARIGKNDGMAAALWKTGRRNHRLLSLLILDPKKVDTIRLEALTADLPVHTEVDQDQIGDWLVSNVILKNRKAPGVSDSWESWESDASPIRRRLYWQVAARTVRADDGARNLRLLEKIEKGIMSETDQVRWTMNWCAASLGIEDEALRARCLRLGETTGLYRDYPTPKGCTSPFLPAWIGAGIRKKAERRA